MAESKEELLGISKKSIWGKAFAGVTVIGLAGAALAWFFLKPELLPAYATQDVVRGNLSVSVTANGTLNPVRTVSIGSELSGIVSRVYVDVNDQVRAGDVLIELDTAKLESAVRQARAALVSAQARLAEVTANAQEAKAKLKRYEMLNLESGGRQPSRSELDVQRAAVAVARAQIDTAKAGISDAQAALATRETELSKASIKAPVDGTILSRTVEPGYAVAATLQAVELLKLATDLRELKLQIDIDEADVGQVRAGQTSHFTVAAFPDREFPAQLHKVAYGASKGTDNVITYTAYLNVSNPEMLLRPGMTATASIRTAERNDVLLVPNTALRFRPIAKRADSGSMMFGPPHRDVQKTAVDKGRMFGQRTQDIYVLRDHKAQKVSIVTGLSNGRETEVVSGDLREGDKVITRQLKTPAGKP